MVSVQKISHDTSVFRFALPENQNAGLPVASCVIARHQVEGDKPIIRPYTPISYEDVGCFKRNDKQKLIQT